MSETIYHLSVEIRTDDPFENIVKSAEAGLHMMRFSNESSYTTIVRDESYNGWSSRETWALNLWLSNDQGLYEMTRERVAEALTTVGQSSSSRASWVGEAVKDFWEELTDPKGDFAPFVDETLTMITDVGSVWRVDWDEIGAHWLQDATESPVSE